MRYARSFRSLPAAALRRKRTARCCCSANCTRTAGTSAARTDGRSPWRFCARSETVCSISTVSMTARSFLMSSSTLRTLTALDGWTDSGSATEPCSPPCGRRRGGSRLLRWTKRRKHAVSTRCAARSKSWSARSCSRARRKRLPPGAIFCETARNSLQPSQRRMRA